MVTDSATLSPYLRDPDVQLMMRAKNGDEEAFTSLVMAYQDRLVGIFFHLINNSQTAEDLAQEVFLRIYRAKDRYEPTAKFSTWLFRIANNLAKNSKRSKGRRREVPLTARDSGPFRPDEKLVADKSALMPTRQLDKSEREQMVQSALSGLNERQKMAVLLHKFEQMSYADIAATMNLKPNAVKSLLSRARESLRSKLQPYMT